MASQSKFTTFKRNIVNLVNWLDHHRLVPVAVAGLMAMLCLILVFFSWMIGYYANAIYGMKFDLSSCWQGITIGISGIGGVMGSAYTIWKMYDTDSQYNSKQGQTRKQTDTEDSMAQLRAMADKYDK